jgi:hypothetical protein
LSLSKAIPALSDDERDQKISRQASLLGVSWLAATRSPIPSGLENLRYGYSRLNDAPAQRRAHTTKLSNL